MMSWTRSGTRIPPIPGPRELFRMLFVEDDAERSSKPPIASPCKARSSTPCWATPSR